MGLRGPTRCLHQSSNMTPRDTGWGTCEPVRAAPDRPPDGLGIGRGWVALLEDSSGGSAIRSQGNGTAEDAIPTSWNARKRKTSAISFAQNVHEHNERDGYIHMNTQYIHIQVSAHHRTATSSQQRARPGVGSSAVSASGGSGLSREAADAPVGR